MALDKTGLIAALVAAFAEQRTKTDDPVAAANALAEKMGDAIDTYVKTGTVAAGIPVATTGSPTAQAGATTAPAPIV